MLRRTTIAIARASTFSIRLHLDARFIGDRRECWIAQFSFPSISILNIQILVACKYNYNWKVVYEQYTLLDVDTQFE